MKKNCIVFPSGMEWRDNTEQTKYEIVKEILLLQLKQPFRYEKLQCMFWFSLFFPYSLSLKWHFHPSLCVAYSPSSCFVFPSFLIMDVSYSKK